MTVLSSSIRLRHYSLLVSLTAGLWLSTPLGAQVSFDWLNEAGHPRGMALANATVAAANPAEALGLNPAGLRWGSPASCSARSFQVSLCRYPAGISQLTSQIILPVGAQVAGFEIRRFDYGTFTGYDDAGRKGNDYTAADILARGGMMRRVGRHLAVGAAVGVLSSRLEEADAIAVLWSLGAQLEVSPLNARLGVAIQNQGRFTTHFGDARPDELPATWLVGLAKSLAHLPLTLYIAAGKNVASDQPLWRLGSEFRLLRCFALRLGVDQGKTDYRRSNTYSDLLSGFSLGFGTRMGEADTPSVKDPERTSRFTLDGAVKFLGPLGFSSSLALGLRF